MERWERERASGYTHIHEGWGHTKLTNDNVPMTTARGYFLIVANQTRALHPHWNYGIRIQYRKIFDKIGDMPFMWHSVSYIEGLSLSHSRTVSPDPHDNRNFNVSFSYIVCLLCIHRYPKLPFHYQHQPVLSSAFRSPWKVSHHAHTNCT